MFNLKGITDSVKIGCGKDMPETGINETGEGASFDRLFMVRHKANLFK